VEVFRGAAAAFLICTLFGNKRDDLVSILLSEVLWVQDFAAHSLFANVQASSLTECLLFEGMKLKIVAKPQRACNG
jgi:hypothetical protein